MYIISWYEYGKKKRNIQKKGWCSCTCVCVLKHRNVCVIYTYIYSHSHSVLAEVILKDIELQDTVKISNCYINYP